MILGESFEYLVEIGKLYTKESIMSSLESHVYVLYISIKVLNEKWIISHCRLTNLENCYVADWSYRKWPQLGRHNTHLTHIIHIETHISPYHIKKYIVVYKRLRTFTFYAVHETLKTTFCNIHHENFMNNFADKSLMIYLLDLFTNSYCLSFHLNFACTAQLREFSINDSRKIDKLWKCEWNLQ